MRIKDGFLARQIVGEWIVIPVGERVADFNGIITLNETAVFLWGLLQENTDQAALLKSLTEEFEVTPEQAQTDLAEFLDSLRINGLLEI